MKILLPILLLSFFSSSGWERREVAAENEVWGMVTMPHAKKVMRGNTYNKDGTPVMHSSDPMSEPDRNVIVSLRPLNFEPDLRPSENSFITQKEQTFLPMVRAVTVGSEVTFVNEDQFDHSIQSLNRNMKPVMRKPPGEYHSRKMNKPGVVKLGCDIHGHMRGYIWCLKTPYFTRVDENGSYRISGLPNGQYQIEVFHPDLARVFVEQEAITIRGGQRLQKDLDLARP